MFELKKAGELGPGAAFTARLEVDYKKPMPASADVICTARVESVEGRKVGGWVGLGVGWTRPGVLLCVALRPTHTCLLPAACCLLPAACCLLPAACNYIRTRSPAPAAAPAGLDGG